MWIPNRILAWFEISKDVVTDLRTEVAVLKAERDILKSQLDITNANFKWVSTRVNALEVERAQLLRNSVGIAVPVPEIVTSTRPKYEFTPDMFNDVGDELAQKLGLPVLDN